MIEIISGQLDRLARRISGRIGVEPTVLCDSPYDWLWADQIETSIWPVKVGARLTIRPEAFCSNVLSLRVQGEIIPPRGHHWRRLYLGEPLDLAQIRDGIPRGLNSRLSQKVVEAWEDINHLKFLERIVERLRASDDAEPFN